MLSKPKFNSNIGVAGELEFLVMLQVNIKEINI
jgi:hypothetical protein